MRIIGWLAFSLFALGSGTAWAKTGGALQVSHLSGRADVVRDAKKHAKADGSIPDAAPWQALKSGAAVAVGDAVRTQPGARLELKMPDGSRVRLDAGTVVTIDAARFGKGTESRDVSLGVWVGRLWAKVAKRAGGDSTFQVQTRNAVAGVRGTSFSVVARTDLSALVKVYTGTVGVKKSGGGNRPGRKEVPGPSRVDQKQWEEIVATSMKQIQISNLGELTPAEDFEDAGEALEWAMWNQSRDEAL